MNSVTITIAVYFWKLYPATEKRKGDPVVIGSLMEDEETQSTVSVTRDTAFSGVCSISSDAEDRLVVASILLSTAANVGLFLLALLLLLLSITITDGFMS